MLDRERQAAIQRILAADGFASIHDIAETVKTSLATVRRDLAKMEEQGIIRRVRGGAELLKQEGEKTPFAGELPFEYRKGLMSEKKRLIAKKAASLCEEGETIIIDGGSTTFHMAEYLRSARLQIITNSFAMAEFLIRNSDNKVIIPGGMVYPESQLILDPFEHSVLKNYYASKAFMGVGGIDELGATNTNMLIIRMEREMIEHSKQVIILADSSKFSKRGTLMLCGFERISMIITDQGIPEESRVMLEKKGVQVLAV